MQVSISSSQALEMIRAAQDHYAEKSGVGVAYRIRVEAMYKFVQDTRKRSPKANIVLTLDDFVLLNEFA